MNTVHIVGAGPGSIDLLTLRAFEKIKTAEVLIWTDSLICPDIANLAPSTCERIKTSSLTLEDIIPLIINRAKKGKRIVRLHDGDPCLYGALYEQISCLKEEGIDIEVIPGISAYQATAAAIKTELTIPGLVQTIVLSRAAGRTGVPENECLEKLASIKASLCLYLSARHVKEVEEILSKHYEPETPVAIGYRVSWKDQWIKIVPLNQMSSATEERGLIRTTLYIISPALTSQQMRSKLYTPNYNHLFRPNKKEDHNLT